MERAPRRRRLRIVALVLVLPLLAIGPWAYAATSAPEVPTISFSATGTPPVVCGTRPNVTNLMIKHGTRVIIANRTGVTATVDVGRRRLLELAPGTGARVRMGRGQHDLQLIPQCVVVSETEKAAVNVLTAAQMRDLLTSSPWPGAEQGNPDGPAVTVEGEPTSASTGDTVTAASSGPESDPAPVTQSGPTTGPAVVDVDPTVPPPTVLEGQAETDDIAIVEGEAFPLEDGSDPKGLRLVGAIATICVLGVTAAIIRAIVSERTTRSVG